MEVLAGGLAAALACVFTNPMEVVKIRLQVQGELQARGEYTTVYRNPVHGLYTMARTDGLRATQAGLGPAMTYQLVMNGVRLGSFAEMEKRGWCGGEEPVGATLACSMLAGSVSGLLGSPVFLVKTHLQTSSSSGIAVGHQHQHGGMVQAFTSIYRVGGVRGLYQGATSSIPRISIGSAAQLVTYSQVVRWLEERRCSPWQTNLLAAAATGFVVAVVINPLDVVATRLYNQPADRSLYSGYLDCVSKIVKIEGSLAFFKGLTAQYLRIGPHSLLQLVFWHHGRRLLGLTDQP